MAGKTYYAVCNANGPISVRLAGETLEQALAAFAALDTGTAIDSASTDAEDDLDIDGAGMSEDEFAAALRGAGAKCVEDLSPIVNAHAGTVAHLADGWTLWSFSDDSSDFEPNAVITIHRANGEIERIPVLCEVSDGKIAPGPCYSKEEWRSSTSADWEYDEDRGLLWQGQPGGPYNFAEYEIRALGHVVLDEDATASEVATPLTDALRAAEQAARAAVEACQGCECEGTPECQASGEDHCTCPHVVAAEAAAEAAAAARDAARAALRDSDEPREYEVNDGNAWWTITSRPSTLEEDVRESVLEGDWDRSSPFRWRGHVRCELTGEDESVTVDVPAEEPRCTEDEHNWQSPYEVLGGLRDNPGVWGKGGGVVVREVCAHCGAYRVTDTWADDGAGGHMTAVSYEDADEDSLAWVAAQEAQS